MSLPGSGPWCMIRARQGSTAEGDVVAYRSIFQEDGWRGRMEFDDFERRLVALDTLAAGRIVLVSASKDIYLRQSPTLILEQIEKALHGEGHDFSPVSGDTTTS